MDVLIVTGSAGDFTALQCILGSGADVHWAKSCAEALQMMSPASVVLCDDDLPDGNWHYIVNKAGERPVLLFSRFPDEALWSDVLESSAYDLLLMPFNREEVRRVTAAARERLTAH